mmetsp:Transcript_17492/g.53326  ORF Transcript_17492/g.53326 Transcript_17492/m.53326 type:complete len:533 (+) Transcript_17492:55-1653(+)
MAARRVDDEEQETGRSLFAELGEDLCLQVLIRTRCASHGALVATCRAFCRILTSKRFEATRRSANYEERALFVWERHLFRPRLLANDGACWRCPRLPLDGAVCVLPSVRKAELVAICRPPRPSVCDDELATAVFDVRRKRWRVVGEENDSSADADGRRRQRAVAQTATTQQQAAQTTAPRKKPSSPSASRPTGARLWSSEGSIAVNSSRTTPPVVKLPRQPNPPVEKTVGSSYLAAAKVGDRIFAVTTNYRQRISTFDGERWSLLKNLAMPEPVVEAALVGVDTTLVVIGGRRAKFARGELPTDALSLVQALDATTLKWRTLPPLPTPRCRSVACVHRSKIYVIGGFKRVRNHFPDDDDDDDDDGVNFDAAHAPVTTRKTPSESSYAYVLDSLDAQRWRRLEARLPSHLNRHTRPLAAAVVHSGSLGGEHVLLYGADDGPSHDRSLGLHDDDLVVRNRIEPPLLLPLDDPQSWIAFDDDLADVFLGSQSGLVANHADLVHESSHVADDHLDFEPPAPRTPYVHPCVASVVLG